MSTSYNRLKDEKSSYLLQHKDNPVHWWSYGPEALQKAKDENKPIFLSIGYSSCHWCHVMAEESFQDQRVAEYLNENFINIKVDKEEFPDLDNYYQQACQLYTQSGGWPLSAFLLPDMRPFFAGTYFPAVAQEGRTSFQELIQELDRAYKTSPEKVQENATKVTEAIEKGTGPKEKVEFPGHFPPPASILKALEQYQDKEDGGYGQAPKFPQFAFYEWAIEQMLDGMVEKDQGEHIVKSLERMLMGGLHDHIRGGVHRYSTDKKWLIPHFEKMLYDQAGFLRVLSKASLLYPSPLLYDALIDTLEYLKLEMSSEEQYFFSSQDADSEGVEGLYFTYTEAEFDDVLNKLSLEEKYPNEFEHQKVKSWFEMTSEGNFERGLNVFSFNYEKRQEIFTQKGWEMIRDIKKGLWEERKGRIPPATDTKGVASWNFMLTSALVDVMQYCQVDVIRRQASELFNNAMEGQYKTFLTTRDAESMSIRHTTTKSSSLPYLENYVFFAEAQLRVFELTGNKVFLENCLDTIKFVQREFIQEDTLLTRAKSTNEQALYPNQVTAPYDTSYRSPLSTFIAVARRVGILTQDKDLLDNIKNIQENLTHDSLRNPLASGEALRALTYPDNAYRVVKVPKNWTSNDKFIKFIPYFLPRFVLDYQEGENEKWQICSLEQCELQGNGIDDFLKTLLPPEVRDKKE